MSNVVSTTLLILQVLSLVVVTTYSEEALGGVCLEQHAVASQVKSNVNRPSVVLIIGASGQVGSALISEFQGAGIAVVGTIHKAHATAGIDTIQFDLEAAASDPQLSESLLTNVQPDIVVISAAFTWADQAELERDRVHTINVAGPVAVVTAAKLRGIKTAVYSSEYVWDGANGPYSEDDAVGPLNVYGASKVDMEARLMQIDASVLILRTTVVFGPERLGKNFVYQLHRTLSAGKSMIVPFDQISTPTYNRDLAKLTRMLLEAGARGIFNACGNELLSRYAFAVLVAKAFGLNTSLIQPSRTHDIRNASAVFPPKAARPLNAGMKMDKAQAFLNGSFHARNVSEAIRDWTQFPGQWSLPLGS